MGDLNAKIALAAALAAGAAVNLYGVRARLPGPGRTGLVVTPGEARDLAEPMKRAREEAYSAYETPETNLDDVFVRNPDETMDAVVGGAAVKIPKTTLDGIRSYFLQPEYADDSAVLYALSNIKPKRLEFDPKLYQYGGLYFYSIGAAIQAGGTLGLFRLTRDIGHYFTRPGDLGSLYAAPRVVQTAASLAAAWLLFLIASRFFGSPAAGAAAAFFYLSAPIVVVLDHWMKAHTLMVPFALGSIYFSLSMLKDPRDRNYLLSAALAGFAMGAVLFGAFSLFALAAAHAAANRDRGARGVLLDRRIVLCAAVFCAAFFAASPYHILSIKSVLGDTKLQTAHDLSSRNFLPNLAGYFFGTLPASLGWGLWGLCAAGLAAAAAERRTEDMVLLAPAAALYLFVCFIHGGNAYGLLMCPLLILAGSVRAFRWAASPRWRVPASAALVLTGAYTYGYAAFYDAVLVRGSQKRPAGEWINRSVPKGASIGFQWRLVYGNGGYPPFRLLDYRLVRVDAKTPKPPDYYLAVRDDDGPAAVRPEWGPLYAVEAAFSRDFGWVDRLYRNRLLIPFEQPIAVYKRRS